MFFKDGFEKEGAVEGDYPRRQWCWKDFFDEPVCEQEVQQSIQGDNWSRFSDEGGDGGRPISDDADLGHSRTGAFSVFGSCVLSRGRLLRALLRRERGQDF